MLSLLIEIVFIVLTYVSIRAMIKIYYINKSRKTSLSLEQHKCCSYCKYYGQNSTILFNSYKCWRHDIDIYWGDDNRCNKFSWSLLRLYDIITNGIVLKENKETYSKSNDIVLNINKNPNDFLGIE